MIRADTGPTTASRRAPGFAEAVTQELEQIAPVMPAIRVSALGTDAVVDGCLAAG